eukprot:COSAG06_NODE_3680_length_5023_cov_11.389115_2_plen_281_part_00
MRCSYLAWRSEPHNQSLLVVWYGYGGDLWDFWLWGSERNRSCGCETAASGAQKRRGPTARATTRAGATLGITTCQCGVVRGWNSAGRPAGCRRAGRRALGGWRWQVVAGSAAKRLTWRRSGGVRPTGSTTAGTASRSMGTRDPRLTLKLGRQATGGAATTPSEFQRGPSSTLRPAGSVLRAQKRRGCNGEGGHTSQSEQPYQPHCHVPVWRGTRLRLGAPDGGVQAGWQTSSGWLVMADSGWFGCETAGMAAKRRVRPTDSAAGTGHKACPVPQASYQEQ